MDINQADKNPENTLSSEGSIEWKKKCLKYLKENLKLLLFIPTFLGGVWQISSLMSIGISYVRFFSLTQVISDGLILMMVVPFLSLFPFGSYWFGKFVKKTIVVSFIPTIILSTISFVGLCYASYIGIKYLLSYFEMEIDADAIFFIYVLVIPLNLIFFTTQRNIEELSKQFWKRQERTANSGLLKLFFKGLKGVVGIWFSWSFFVHFTSYLTWGLISFKLLLSIGNYYLPDNLVNVSRINKIVEEKYNIKPKDFEISYFNDTYIFIEYSELSKEEVDELNKQSKVVPSKVIILKTEALFDE